VRVHRGAPWGVGLAGAAVILMVALNVWRPQHGQPMEEPEVVVQEVKFEEKPDAGTAGARKLCLRRRCMKGYPW
jgi:hypothetical protein